MSEENLWSRKNVNVQNMIMQRAQFLHLAYAGQGRSQDFKNGYAKLFSSTKTSRRERVCTNGGGDAGRRIHDGLTILVVFGSGSIHQTRSCLDCDTTLRYMIKWGDT